MTVLLVGWSQPDEKQNVLRVETADLTTKSDDIISKSKQHQINTIYVNINTNRSSFYYKEFIRKANEAGIDVHALEGKPSWGLEANQQSLIDFTKWVERYNGKVSENEKFEGIHLDIQAQHTEQWDENSKSVIEDWKANLSAFQNELSDAELTTSVSIPFYLGGFETPDQPEMPFNEWVIKQFDHTSILAHRDTIEGERGVIALIKDELKVANELGKKVSVGVTLADTGEDVTSFYEEGTEDMQMHLDVLQKHMKDNPAYTGYSIDQYSYLSTEKENPTTETEDTQQETSQSDLVKGTYIWHASNLIESPDEIIDFAKENNLNFLYTRLDRTKNFSVYKDFVEKAHAAGIEVHAMGGHPTWALQKGEKRMKMFVDYVTNYNASVSKEQQFDGIHLDVEPYTLQEWSEDKNAVMKTWKDNMELFVDEVEQKSNLETSVSLAMWLDDHETPGQPNLSFSKWVIKQLDHTAIMAFRDSSEGPGGIVDVSKEEVAFANNLGKDIIISVEMQKMEEAPHISFYEEGEEEMVTELDKTENALEENSSYQGEVVHSYEYWKDAAK